MSHNSESIPARLLAIGHWTRLDPSQQDRGGQESSTNLLGPPEFRDTDLVRSTFVTETPAIYTNTNLAHFTFKPKARAHPDSIFFSPESILRIDGHSLLRHILRHYSPFSSILTRSFGQDLHGPH